MQHRLGSVLTLLVAWLNVLAQDVKTVDADYTYFAPETMPLIVAKRIALERAQLQAIADVFKTTLNQTNFTFVDTQSNTSETTFKSYSTSNICGEWIETTREPKYDITFNDNMQIVKVSLSGKIREIPKSRAQLELTLCNNVRNPYHTTTFHNGESVFLKFRSSHNGYVMVFLEDEENNAIRLLPFVSVDDACIEVKKDKEYTFFMDKDDAAEKDLVCGESLTLTASHDKELNVVNIIYSPTLIKRPIYDSFDDSSFEYMPKARFQKWISELQVSNHHLIAIQFPIIINL